MTDFTVAVPTFNGESRLPALLDRLRDQSEVESLAWEVLIVDNNSSDGTRNIVLHYQSAWPSRAELLYCVEPRQGTAFARIRAVTEARGPLVGFLDDDVLPARNWIAAALQFGRTHPRAGAYASRVHAKFASEPPPQFERIASYFGITERGTEPFEYTPRQKMLPPAAALVVRKQAWRGAVGANSQLTGPTGIERHSGEDLEAILRIQRAGWEIWYNPLMEAEHFLPAGRLTRESLLAVSKAAGLARYPIRRMRWSRWQVLPGTVLGFLQDIGRLVNYRYSHRRALRGTIVAECELEALKWTLLSPLHHIRRDH